ncbi:MAG: cupin domain-containing protein [Thermodesulfobacteriota bacterium]
MKARTEKTLGKDAQLTPEAVIRELGLSPLPLEGGYFVRSYTSDREIPEEGPGVPGGEPRRLATAIYYLMTPSSFSRLHRLKQDELWHFYLGDPVRMLLLYPDGSGGEKVLGTDLLSGQRPQAVAPGGTWFGGSLAPGGRFALIGCTLSPGYSDDDYEHGSRAELSSRYPAFSKQIARLLPV